MKTSDHHSSHTHAPNTSGRHAKDPVCGMMVDTATAKHSSTFAEQVFYFCSSKCQEKFTAEPAKFTGRQAASGNAPARTGTVYTCPMHPEIR
jgi:Cu+-exporting ATPase